MYTTIRTNHIICKCLFPATGCGARFMPATKARLKEMLHVLTPYFYILRTTKPWKGGETQVADALLEQAKQGKVIAYKFKGKRFDCGSVDGFVQATNHFYNENKGN